MDYYEEIKNELINNEVYKKVKDYSKNKNDLMTYYNVGKLFFEAGKHYGEGIIKEYSKRLKIEIGKKYSVRYLFDFRKLYLFTKVHPLDAQLTMSHYRILFSLNDDKEIIYYINLIINRNLSKRELISRIKSNEYKRLSEETKQKLILKEETKMDDFIKNPIIIRNSNSIENISEKVLKNLILEDIEHFMNELGNGYSFIGSEYKIKIDDRYNYIDILLFNIRYKCHVVIELKVTELKKEHIGQIEIYINYINKNIKTNEEDKTVGIIICRKDNKFIMGYASDERVYSRSYELL